MIDKRVDSFMDSFQLGYSNRDHSTLAEFIKQHFDEDSQVHVVGTSDNEIYIGQEDIYDLLNSDWKYWGNLRLDCNNKIYKLINDNIIIVVKATVQYNFSDSDDTLEKFLNLIYLINNDIKYNVYNPLAARQNEIISILSHLLHSRQTEERINQYPLYLIFVLKNIKNKLLIKQLMFNSLVPINTFPDERFNELNNYKLQFNKDLTKICNKGSTLVSDIDITQIKESEDFIFIDTDGQIYSNVQAKVMKKKRIENFDSFKSFNSKSLVYKNKNMLSFISLGVAKKIISEKTMRDNARLSINDILSSKLCARDKLFKTRQILTNINKELSYGETFSWPIRIFGVLIFNKGDYNLKVLSLSYPINVILEDKYL